VNEFVDGRFPALVADFCDSFCVTRNKSVPCQFSAEKKGEGKGGFMTRNELMLKQEDMWQALSGEQSMTLTLAVEMLQRCHLSPHQILMKTMTALEGSEDDS
jgi:hypothetical protein